LFLENLLNSSKTPTETISRPATATTTTTVPAARFGENVDDDENRHERTGSVKFADQAEDIREVIRLKTKMKSIST